MCRISRHLTCLLLLAIPLTGAGAPAQLPPIRVIPKPVDIAVERHPRAQPPAPEDAKQIPFNETAPDPALTDVEKARGYLLFQRPTTETVYPTTRPLPPKRRE